MADSVMDFSLNSEPNSIPELLLLNDLLKESVAFGT